MLFSLVSITSHIFPLPDKYFIGETFLCTLAHKCAIIYLKETNMSGIRPEVNFWRKVKKTRACWVWTGCKRQGYGIMGDGKGGQVSTHRFSWELHFGPIPDGLIICHTCDNPSCVNPSHLYAGTQSDNMKDAWGERHVIRKISIKQPCYYKGKHYPSYRACYLDNYSIATTTIQIFMRRIRKGLSVEKALTGVYKIS